MLLALHLFKLPDADLVLHYGDGCPPEGMPLICESRAGWLMGLGKGSWTWT
jgi:hypothetical protein